MQAELTYADPSGADLRAATLDEPEITASVLSRADLTGASLRNATIDNVHFIKATLDHARFTGATITDTSNYRASQTETQFP